MFSPAGKSRETGVRMRTKGLKHFGKKAIAVLMALCLSVLMVPAVAFANISAQDSNLAPASIDSDEYAVEVDASEANASDEAGTNIDTTTKNGLGVLAKNTHTGTATVGNVAAAAKRGVYAHADGGSTNVTAKAVTGTYNTAAVWTKGANASSNVTVDSVNATIVADGYNKNYGIYSDAGTSGALNVKVNGDVTIQKGVPNYTTAVYSKTTDLTAASTVEVGNVNVTEANRALSVDSDGGGTAKLTAGNVTATDVGVGSYQYSAVYARANKGKAELNMGNLNGLGGTFVGMKVSASNGGNLIVNAGDISTVAESGSSGSYGLDGSTTDAGSQATIEVGNIAAKYNGLNLIAYSGTTLNLKTGNISGAQWNNLRADGGTVNADLGTISGSKHAGLNISGTAAAGSRYEVTTGPITSEEKALSLYTYASADNPDKITVNGDLTSTGTSHEGGGIYASSSSGCIDLTVNGNVTSNYYTISGNLGGTVAITGDVSTAHEGGGIPAIGSVAYAKPLDLLVAGTISSTGPAMSDNTDSYSRLTLTTWKIVAGAGAEMFSGDTDDAFAKTVNYIVEVEPASAGVASVSAVKADGSALAKSHGYDVARQGERVVLKAALDPAYEANGYRLVAYNGKGKETLLSKGADGNYYYDVPKGGGVHLSVAASNTYTVKFANDDGTELSSKSYEYGTKAADVVAPSNPTKPADAQYTYTFAGWDPAIADVVADVVYKATYTSTVNKYTVSFDSDGGTEVAAQTVDYGSKATKPADPAKENATFKEWQLDGKAYDFDTAVTGNVALKAVYEENPPVTHVMYRLYNQYSGEHHYTANVAERDACIEAGWTDEGEAWVAPDTSSTPVYRLYNPYEPLGDHHYTVDKQEYDDCVAAGWAGEDVGWYSDDAHGAPLYRVYNPNAYALGMTGAHHYTADKGEYDGLAEIGWIAEDIAWYGVSQ